MLPGRLDGHPIREKIESKHARDPAMLVDITEKFISQTWVRLSYVELEVIFDNAWRWHGDGRRL
jgi:UDP-glucose 4-epimerase